MLHEKGERATASFPSALRSGPCLRVLLPSVGREDATLAAPDEGYEVENLGVLQLDPFRKFGKPNKIADFFGGKEGYLKAVKELEGELYKAG